MIRGRGVANGKPLLLLGIDGENMTRLVADEPILIRPKEMKDMGLPEMSILICYGKTLADVSVKLMAMGIVDDKTEVHHRDE